MCLKENIVVVHEMVSRKQGKESFNLITYWEETGHSHTVKNLLHSHFDIFLSTLSTTKKKTFFGVVSCVCLLSSSLAICNHYLAIEIMKLEFVYLNEKYYAYAIATFV